MIELFRRTPLEELKTAFDGVCGLMKSRENLEGELARKTAKIQELRDENYQLKNRISELDLQLPKH